MSAWPVMPEWVDVADRSVRRGERVRVRWAAAGVDGHELRLVLVVCPGERRMVHDRVVLDGLDGTSSLRVPPGAPYSYPGARLGFAWGVALVHAERERGWSALEVRP